MAALTLTVEYDDSTDGVSVASRLAYDASARMEAMVALSNEFAAIAGGATRANVTLGVQSDGGTRASGAITLTSGIAPGDMVDIGPASLEFVAGSPADENEVQIGGDEGESADNLAAAINAHSGLSGLVSAESDGAGVVSVTAVAPGLSGNLIGIGGTGGVQPSDNTLTGGADPTYEAEPRTYELGG